MHSIDWNPTRQTLRTFAIGLLVLACAYVAWKAWQGHLRSSQALLCGVAGTLGLVGLISPSLLKWVYVAWMVVVFPIGWCVFQVLLATLYFGVITPLGLLMKLVGRDPLQLRPDPQATTYWNERAPSDDPRRHFRQY